MKYFSENKKNLSIACASALILGLTGMVHAQSQNLKDESAQKSATSEKKSADKDKAADKTKGEYRKQPGSEKNTENYEGAQPPQGGRLGQGPDEKELK